MITNPQLFSSKAETLLFLSAHKELHIPQSFAFSVREWKNDCSKVLTALLDFFPKNTSLAVRSSSKKEDTSETSAAGAFESVLNIACTQSELTAATEKILASYGTLENNDEILVQKMITDIEVSGVLTTRVLADGSPYYVVNYDDETGKTDTVTAGSTISKTVYIFRKTDKNAFDSDRLFSFLKLARRVEELCHSDSLDIEFCMDKSGTVHLLQVRPLCTKKQWISGVDEHVEKNIDFVRNFVDQHMNRQPNIFGSRTILGVMPDWNPAEMIGTTPRRLSSSLYRYLITSRIWSMAREQMGYRPMPPAELMLLIGGRPYIDVRVSFNSFLPADLDDVSSEILVNAWLKRLHNNPFLHDKIEFEIAQTVLDFSFEQNMENRYPGLLSPDRKEGFRLALHRLTAACLDLSPTGSLQWAITKSKELEARQAVRQDNHKNNIPNQIKNLLDECCNFGTLPFSILARHAFIAESFLRSAVQRNALTPERLRELKTSIQTISSKMAHDFSLTCSGKMEQHIFLQQYGHLRPGSYDILSPRYADRADLFTHTNQPIVSLTTEHFVFTPQETKALNALFAEAGLFVNADFLLEYARKAISGRELSKFIFTRNISDVLELLARWGEETTCLSREDLSYLDIRDILEWNTCALLQSPKNYFRQCVDKGRTFHDLGRSLKLGYLIRSSDDVYIVPQHRSAPNFVGIGNVDRPISHLKADSPCSTEIEGKIICIENADPGFDWIFTRNIAGLVTMYGGTNSHMTIRCAEYGLPAAIGVGTLIFTKIINAGHCRLNTTACIVQEA